MLVLPPFLRPVFPGASLVGAAFFVLLLTVRTLFVAGGSRLFRAVQVTAMIAVAVRAAGGAGFFLHGPWGLELGLRLMTALGFTFVVISLLREVLASGPVDSDRLYAAVSAYLLIGLAFASAYEAIAFWKPEAFRFSGTGFDADTLFYFSLVTLSTVGYGDVVPNMSETRVLAVSEAIAGQLYLAILMARLVGLHLNRPVNLSEDDR